MTLFILPPTCVERVTMGVLLLLTVVIISLMLDSYMPKGATTVTIIGTLIGFTMFMITWTTLFSCLIISIDKDYFVYRNIPTCHEKVKFTLTILIELLMIGFV